MKQIISIVILIILNTIAISISLYFGSIKEYSLCLFFILISIIFLALSSYQWSFMHKLNRSLKWSDFTEEQQTELLKQFLASLPYKNMTNNKKTITEEFFNSSDECTDWFKRIGRLTTTHKIVTNSNHWDSISQAMNILSGACQTPQQIIAMIYKIALYPWHKNVISIID
jgi:hypothetical protein